MADLALSIAHRAARNAASVALADAGAGSSAIRIYTAAPASGGTLLATIALQKPCGVVVPETGRVTLAPDLANPPLCMATGAAAWGEWVDGDGTPIGAGTVAAEGSSDDACFYIIGTQPGSTKLWAGGTLSLASIIFG